MKTTLILLALSFNVMASNLVPITCEMTSTTNPENRIFATITEIEEGQGTDEKYSFAQANEAIDDMYGFAMELTANNRYEGEINIVVVDENDEVGSFYCDFADRPKYSRTICTEPVYDENDKYMYDITCYFGTLRPVKK